MMRTATIKGGVAVKLGKVTTSIEDFPLPSKVIIPLKQHQGSAAKASVKKGQTVKVGDIIGEGEVPVHASVSGKVSGVAKRFPDLQGGYGVAVGIEVQGEQEIVIGEAYVDPQSLSLDEVIQAAKKNGLVDYGFETVPLAEKLELAKKKGVKILIVNAVDLEPGTGINSCLVKEKTEEIVGGIKVLKNILGITEAYLAIEQEVAEGLRVGSEVELVGVNPKFPVGLPKFLVKAVTGAEVPSPYGQPEDIGVIVISVEAVFNLWETLRTKIPPVNKLVTIYGAVQRPKNLRVRIGTPIKEVLEYCGMPPDVAKVIVGGPMMGWAQWTLDVPVTKEVNAVYVQRESELNAISDQKCINCGWCVEVCPMRLLPHIIASYCEVGMFEEARSYDLEYCVECGCCAYVCPVKIPLVHWIKYGKSQIKREEQ